VTVLAKMLDQWAAMPTSFLINISPNPGAIAPVGPRGVAARIRGRIQVISLP
jgi:hypothetical protein